MNKEHNRDEHGTLKEDEACTICHSQEKESSFTDKTISEFREKFVDYLGGFIEFRSAGVEKVEQFIREKLEEAFYEGEKNEFQNEVAALKERKGDWLESGIQLERSRLIELIERKAGTSLGFSHAQQARCPKCVVKICLDDLLQELKK